MCCDLARDLQLHVSDHIPSLERVPSAQRSARVKGQRACQGRIRRTRPETTCRTVWQAARLANDPKITTYVTVSGAIQGQISRRVPNNSGGAARRQRRRQQLQSHTVVSTTASSLPCVCRQRATRGQRRTEGVGAGADLVEQHQAAAVGFMPRLLYSPQVPRERGQRRRQRLLVPDVGQHRRKVRQHGRRVRRHPQPGVGQGHCQAEGLEGGRFAAGVWARDDNCPIAGRRGEGDRHDGGRRRRFGHPF